MNVIISNEHQNYLANLDIDVIKSLNGVYKSSEIVEMFKSFFYSNMILDVTAIKDYKDIKSYETIVQGLDPSKIIFLLPEGSQLCTPNFLSQLIAIGIYNFTTNVDGIKYLLKKANTLKDVEHIRKMVHVSSPSNDSMGKESTIMTTVKVSDGTTIIGVKNVTEHSGATTFIYLLKKELVFHYGSDNVLAIEIDKNDFQLFHDKNMISVKQADIQAVLKKHSSKNIILIDLNSVNDDSFCADTLYLMEPSTIKLNRLVSRNKMIFTKLVDKKVILNQSLLLNSDVFDFEKEAGIKVFYNMPPLDERKRNGVVADFLSRLGLLESDKKNNGSGRIFGLFRR